MHQRLVSGPTILAALLASVACAPKNPNELPGGSPEGNHVLVVHGVVMDGLKGLPISGVTVTVRSADNAPATTTDATGYFQVKNLAQQDMIIVQLSKAGYKPLSTTKSTTVLIGSGTGSCPVGSAIVPAGCMVHLDSLDFSATLAPDVELGVGGWVWAGTTPAAGATVWLVSFGTASCGGAAAYFGSALTDAQGHFLFPQVPPGNYAVRVWPFDKTGAGVAHYRLYNKCLGSIDSADTHNLTNLSLVLEDETGVIVASSFQNLTTDLEIPGLDGYPWTYGNLTSSPAINGVACIGCGVGGTLVGAGTSFFLHFGAVVNTSMAVFELVDMDIGDGTAAGQRFGPPLPVAVAWDHDVIATITPAAPLTASTDRNRRYQLRIKSLQFADGSFLVDPRAIAPGRVTFEYVATPTYLANPTPAFFFDNYISYSGVTNGKLTTTRVMVDAATLWPLDVNNDFPFGYSPAGQPTAGGFQLKWSHVANATAYRIYARNVPPAGTPNIADNRRLWRQVNGSVAFTVDPNGQTTIIATGVMGGGPFASFADYGAPATFTGGLSYPWLFGNVVQVAVTSVGQGGFESPIDVAKVLAMQDTFGPLVATGGTLNPGALNSDFRAGSASSSLKVVTNRGQTFRKVVQVPFSEPILTTSAPVFTSRSKHLTITSQLPTSWSGVADQPNNFVDLLQTPLNLSVPGPCTEVLVARTGVPAAVNPARGDTLIPVRSTSLFTVSATARVVFVAPTYTTGAGTAGWLDEITGITAVDANLGRVTLALGLQNSVPANTLMCLVDAPASNSQAFISVGGPTGQEVAVNNASLFVQGETVALYRPQAGGNPNQLLQTFTITGLDTVSSPNTISLSAVPSATHNTTTVVFPAPVGFTRYGASAPTGEYILRPKNDISGLLKTDITGGPNTTVTLLGTAASLAVGDVVIFDVDGDTTKTFVDQTFATVKAIQFLPNATTPSFTFVVDLTPGVVYIHGQSAVIALGDAFTISGVQDTSGTQASPHPVNAHQDTFTADGSIY